MPILPQGSGISLVQTSPSVTAALYVESVDYSFSSEFFDRNEFSNDRLRQAKYSDGSTPIFFTNNGGQPVQVLNTCAGVVAGRPLGTDDANIDSIKKRFDIKTYTIRGLPSLSAEVDKIYTIAAAHKILFDRFQAHAAMVQMDVSYEFLLTLQAETFSYLTSTGLALSGASIESSQSNMLIRDFTSEVSHEIPGSSSSTVYKIYSLTLANLQIKNARATS